MPAVTVRNLPEETHRALKVRAAHNGRSTEAEIRRIHAASGYLADPHTAIGIAAARALAPGHGIPVIAMATAHPAKFPDAMERATGQRPALPPSLADLFEREEKFVVLPNDLAAVEANVRALVYRNAPQA